jgi:MFS family permease
VPYPKAIFNFHWFNFYNAICFQIIIGAPVVLLAKDLGANSVILGVIAAFTPLMTVLQLPAARYLGRYSYRSFALSGWALRSIFIAIVAFVPMMHSVSRGGRLSILLGCLFFFNFLRGISTTAFLPWITTLVGSEMRGRYLSVDQLFINFGSIITMLLSALLMHGSANPLRYSLVIWLSVAGAAISLLYLRLIPDAAEQRREESSSQRVPLREMASLVPFRNWILFNLLFTVVAGGLGVFPIEYLKMQARFSPSMIYLLSLGSFLGPLLFLQAVGRGVDRVGSTIFIRWAVLLFAMILMLWFAMSAGVLPHDWRLVLLLNLLGGTAVAIYNMANGHLWMAVVPELGKNHYFALGMVIMSLASGVVPILWGWLLDSLGGLDIMAGPFHLRRHSIYFIGIAMVSVMAFFASRILVEPRKPGIRLAG